MSAKRLYLYILVLFAFAGCTGGGRLDTGRSNGRVAQPSDSLYTMEKVLECFGTLPEQKERVMLIIDSAEIVGNIEPFMAQLLRAKVYSQSCEGMQLDSAIVICEQLMDDESVKVNDGYKESVLELLVHSCRLCRDYEGCLLWATELVDHCLKQGEETEALRNEAEVGALLAQLGETDEGLAKIDSVINLLDGKRKFNEMDASIIAMKRKIFVLREAASVGAVEEAAGVIAVTQRMLSLLDDFEKHPNVYHDDTYREPTDEERPCYIEFYRAQAYNYLAHAYALQDDDAQAWHYLNLFEQSPYGQTLNGRESSAATYALLGDYGRMLSVYEEWEREMGSDTLNDNFAIILQARAEAAEAQRRYPEAVALWKRHDNLSNMLNDRLLQGKAHLYAARFHVQEQQREIERHLEGKRRAVIKGTVFSIIGFLILLFAIYAVIQWYKTHRHNCILAQQITEALEYKDKYKELKEQRTALVSQDSTTRSETTTMTDIPQSDAELFAYLRELIEREKLYLNPNFERQTLITLTGLSKERIGAAFSQGGGHERLTALVLELRLDYAVRLMNEQPNFTVKQVSQASGFSNADTFTRNFRAKFGMTPTAYRETKR